MSKRLMESLDSIVDKEKRKQAIIFEFTPNTSKSEDRLVSLLDNINIQVIQLERLLGKENRLTQLNYELQGHNLRTALVQIHVWLQQHSPEGKQSDRHFEDINNRVKTINESLKKKLENPSASQQGMNLQMLKEIKDLYDLFKGLLKFENIIDRSLTLSRTYDKLTVMKEDRPFDFESTDARTADIKRRSDELQAKVTAVAEKRAKSFGDFNTKLVDLETKMKAKL